MGPLSILYTSVKGKTTLIASLIVALLVVSLYVYVAGLHKDIEVLDAKLQASQSAVALVKQANAKLSDSLEVQRKAMFEIKNASSELETAYKVALDANKSLVKKSNSNKARLESIHVPLTCEGAFDVLRTEAINKLKGLN